MRETSVWASWLWCTPSTAFVPGTDRLQANLFSSLGVHRGRRNGFLEMGHCLEAVTNSTSRSFSYGRGWRGPCLGEGARVKSLRTGRRPCERSVALFPGGPSRVNFEATFEELYPGLFLYCHRLTGDPDLAEDVVQEAFVRLYDRRVEGTDEGLRAWLFRTATHLVRDRHRVRENRRRLLEAYPVRPGGSEPARRGGATTRAGGPCARSTGAPERTRTRYAADAACRLQLSRDRRSGGGRAVCSLHSERTNSERGHFYFNQTGHFYFNATEE